MGLETVALEGGRGDWEAMGTYITLIRAVRLTDLQGLEGASKYS